MLAYYFRVHWSSGIFAKIGGGDRERGTALTAALQYFTAIFSPNKWCYALTISGLNRTQSLAGLHVTCYPGPHQFYPFCLCSCNGNVEVLQARAGCTLYEIDKLTIPSLAVLVLI